MFRSTFSTTTMASSTTIPIASTRPNNDNALMLRSEEHTSELQSQSNLVCRLLLEKKKTNIFSTHPGFTPARTGITRRSARTSFVPADRRACGETYADALDTFGVGFNG